VRGEFVPLVPDPRDCLLQEQCMRLRVYYPGKLQLKGAAPPQIPVTMQYAARCGGVLHPNTMDTFEPLPPEPLG
jgi:hypothetical protein